MIKKPLVIFFLIWMSIFNLFAQNDSLNSQTKSKQILKAAIIPSILFTTAIINYEDHGFYSSVDARNDIKNNFPDFNTKLDNYTQFTPIVLTYGLDAIGIKAENELLNRSLILLKSEILANGITQILKYTIQKQRPSGNANESFPSGHTTQAFVSATFMHKEYGKKSIWYSVLAYSFATSTGAMRMLNDRHWFSDVLAGAAIGIFSTEMIYISYQYKWGKKSLGIYPILNNQSIGFCLNSNF